MKINEICGCKCKIDDDGNIYWDDGCYRLFYPNGHEKEAKVITRVDGKKHYHYSYRDENGNIIREYIGEKL